MSSQNENQPPTASLLKEGQLFCKVAALLKQKKMQLAAQEVELAKQECLIAVMKHRVSTQEQIQHINNIFKEIEEAKFIIEEEKRKINALEGFLGLDTQEGAQAAENNILEQ